MKKFLLVLATTAALTPFSALADNLVSDRPASENTNTGESRWTTSFTITGENENSLTIETGATAEVHTAYFDKTSEVLSVTPGELLTLTYNAEGSKGGLAAYLYVDYDNDGTFAFSTSLDYYTSNEYAGSADHNELVTFNAYRFFVTSAKNYHNSDGTDLGTSTPSSWTSDVASQSLPKVKIPEDLAPGKYYVRFKTDWNNINTPGDVLKNDGVIIDFYFEVAGDVEVEQHTVTVTAPDAAQGTLTVTANDAAIEGEATVDNGTVLTIEATPAEGYAVDAVTANGSALAANDEGKYTYTVKGEDVTIAASFISKADVKPTVTFTTSGDSGTVTVTANDETLESGAQVEPGTEVTVKVSYAFNSTVTVNNSEVNGADGVYTFTVNEDTNIAIALTQKYTCAIKTTTGDEVRWITAITVSGDDTNLKLETGATAYKHDYWVDKTDNVLTVKPGEEITLAQEGEGTKGGLCSHLYIDYDNNGTFDYETALDYYANGTATLSKDNELVTFNAHRFVSGGSFYDSNGVAITGATPASWSIEESSNYFPTFIVPKGLQAGKYYARFTSNWNELNPLADKSNQNGVVIDFVIEVPAGIQVEQHTVTVTAPDAAQGTLTVTANDAAIEGEATVDYGTTLTIEATAAEGYVVEAVTANGSALEANDEGKYTYTVKGEDVTIAASFISKADVKPTVTFTTSGDSGTVTVTANDEALESGAQVERGTEVTVKVSYAYDSKVTVNGSSVEGTDGVYTVVVDEDTDIAIVLTRKYTCAIKTTTGDEVRWITAITLSGDDSNLKIETGATSYHHDYWVDRTDNVLTVKPGEEIKLAQEGEGTKGGLCSFLYIDYDNSRSFDYETSLDYYANGTATLSQDNELVTFNAYRLVSGSTDFYNSNGENVTSANPGDWTLAVSSEYFPTFIVPKGLQAGKYYARFTSNWNDINPTNDKAHQNGVVIDFVIEVPADVQVEQHKVTVTAPDAAQGTLTVSANGEAINGEATVDYGTTLTIEATAAEGYYLDKVTANDEELTKNSEGNYTYRVKDEDVVIAATFVTLGDIKPAITLSADNGTITVLEGINELEEGTQVAQGTELTIEVRPNGGYSLTALKVNGTPLEAEETEDNLSVFTYTVNDAELAISAEFASLGYAASSANRASSDRYVSSITLTDEAGHTGTITGPGQTTGTVYKNESAQSVQLAPNSPVTVTCVGGGVWMHTYVYVDFNNNGTFDYKFEDGGVTVTEDSELVAFNMYKNGDSWYNSNGEIQTVAVGDSYASNGAALINGPTVSIPTFTIPNDVAPGKYRARYKVDWNSIDPTGDSSIGTNRGSIIDFTIEVVRDSREVSVATREGQEEVGSVVVAKAENGTIETVDAVRMQATANGEAKFMGWTNAAGSLLSTKATYTYNGAAAETITANFGYDVTLKHDDNGTASVSATPAYDLLDMTNENSKVRPLAEDTTLEDAFAGIVLDTKNDSETFLANAPIYVNVVANDGQCFHKVELLDAATSEVLWEYAREANWYKISEKSLAVTAALDRPYTVNVLYWDVTNGVADIAVDGNAAEAQYFNLNGVRIDAANLTPGLYIVRRGNEVNKVVVK